ncbi:protein kinase domain-containing protein [Parafrankia sp. FMc2]|uniref:protein kinase domain-containing protein n=1 Tax=Parafrankia sp. FMc2 TaxID=3233196 RepID=UPI0034D72D24
MTALGGTPELVVRDDRGRALVLESIPLGRGGQGRVHRVRNSRLAVKLIDGVRWRPDLADDLMARLRSINRLPLDGLPLSRPVAHLVEPHVGYVMELLESVVPLGELASAPTGELSGWYLDSGGLARRLRVLTKLAWVLSTLHGRGIVYGDLSPTNVVVSARPEQDHLWLIDTDNLSFQADAARHIAGTPGYGAPELASAKASLSTLSDAFAFAVLAFKTLVGLHPFRGDQFFDEDDDDYTRLEQLNESAAAFRLPWVDHSSETSNRLSYGIPRNWVLDAALRRLCRETFEEGLRSPRNRPGMSAWYAALSRAADATHACPNCQHTFYVGNRACPWCGIPAPSVLVGRVFAQLTRPDFSADDDRYEPALVDTRDLVVVEAGGWTPILSRVGHLAARGDPFEPVANVGWDGGDRMSVHNPGPRSFHLVAQEGRNRRRLMAGERVDVLVRPGSTTWLLHLTDQLTAPHRLAVFDVHAWKH